MSTGRTIAIHQPHYLPWLGYFAKAALADTFVLLDTVCYTKNGYQNRNRIRTAAAVHWLTVPVHVSLGDRIERVRLANDERWGRRHLHALQSAYGRAPFFDRYFPELDRLLRGSWTHLVDLNEAVVRWTSAQLGLTCRYVRASTLTARSGSSERLLDLCLALGATRYLAGPDMRKYLDTRLFDSHGIAVACQQYTHPIYAQVHGGEFVPYLSALDLLFNMGERSREILTSGHHELVMAGGAEA